MLVPGIGNELNLDLAHSNVEGTCHGNKTKELTALSLGVKTTKKSKAGRSTFLAFIFYPFWDLDLIFFCYFYSISVFKINSYEH